MAEDEGRSPDLVDVIDIRTRGAPRRELYINHERDLTEADMAALALPRGVQPKSLVRLHASHHSLARCLAMGLRPAQAALVTGYAASRISILQGDPAFQALVEDYRNEAKTVTADMVSRMSDFSLDALEILQERLQSDPTGFTIPVLLDIITRFADRTGHGPGQDVNLKVSQDFIDRPPRESFEEWQSRRERELAPEEPKKIN